MSNIDLTQLSAEQLEAELKKRKQAISENRKAYKELVSDALPEIMLRIEALSEQLQEAKLYLFESLKILLDEKNSAYGTKGDNQTHTFSDDKGNTVTYGFRVIDAWDDTVNAGVEKVRDFLQSLAKDEKTGKLVDMINRLLRKDAKGNLKANRVLELAKLAEDFDYEELTDAVRIIQQAYKPAKSAYFVEAFRTDAQGRKINIPLSITAVDFPADTDVEALFPVHQKYQ